MSLPDDRWQLWFVALFVAGVQVSIAVVAIYSSIQNNLSDGACIGGIFGTLVNMVILVLATPAALVLAFRSRGRKELHPWVAPLLLVTLSSVVAILIGLQAGLRCTV